MTGGSLVVRELHAEIDTQPYDLQVNARLSQFMF